nr:MAG TPA: hypothetical protein [Caudoviricetes sp.]
MMAGEKGNRMKKIIFAVILTAIISVTATRACMIYSAQPDRACSITWQGETHDYK